MKTSIKIKRGIKKKVGTALGIKKAPPARKTFSRKTIVANTAEKILKFTKS